MTICAQIVVMAPAMTNAYIMPSYSAPTKRSALMMKRGRGSFQKELGNSGGNSKGSAGQGSLGQSAGSGKEWITVPKIRTKDLPKEEGKIGLIETMALPLVDRNTNPQGAVSVLKHDDDMFCFSVSCPSCKIPLTKAKVLPASDDSKGAPRLSCDFCKSTYSLTTGEQLESAEQTGLLGGIAKSLFSANKEAGPLPVYALGERDGRVMISLKK